MAKRKQKTIKWSNEKRKTIKWPSGKRETIKWVSEIYCFIVCMYLYVQGTDMYVYVTNVLFYCVYVCVCD
jgi:hypothetical protein